MKEHTDVIWPYIRPSLYVSKSSKRIKAIQFPKNITSRNAFNRWVKANSGRKQKKLTHTLQNHRCAICHEYRSISSTTWDHIIPLSGGGTNELFNLQLVCKRCNRDKGRFNYVKFYLTILIIFYII